MGVMECDRKGCENIMCDRYSSTYGYLCHDCFEEMEQRRVDIATFMATPKKAAIAYNYEDEFTLRDNDEP